MTVKYVASCDISRPDKRRIFAETRRYDKRPSGWRLASSSDGGFDNGNEFRHARYESAAQDQKRWIEGVHDSYCTVRKTPFRLTDNPTRQRVSGTMRLENRLGGDGVLAPRPGDQRTPGGRVGA